MPAPDAHPCWICGSAAAPAPEYPVTGYCRCGSCGLLFVPERASAETEAEIYDGEYFSEYPGGEGYDEDTHQRRHEARERLPLVAPNGAHGRLLEIGAATGYFVQTASAAGFDASGIEPAADQAATAQSQGIDVTARVVQDLDPATDGPFDVICAWHVVEHLPDPLAMLESILALLAPGGLLCLEVPNVESVIARSEGEAWVHLDPDHHVAHYGPGTLKTLLERAGFTAVETSSVSALKYVRPARLLPPRGIAAVVKELARTRVPYWRLDADRHELLRATARRPA